MKIPNKEITGNLIRIFMEWVDRKFGNIFAGSKYK